MLDEQIDLLTDFRNKLWKNGANTKAENLFLAESLSRLIRLNYLLMRYKQNKESGTMNDLILDAENFYYQAFRIICCLKELPQFGDGLKNKFEEIRNIRNLLLEHTGSHTEPLSLAYSISHDMNNLKIRPQNSAHIYHEDAGFEINVDVFKTKLNQILNNAIENL